MFVEFPRYIAPELHLLIMLFPLSLTICCYCYNLLLLLIIIMITRTNSETENYFCSTKYSCGNDLQMYYPFWNSGTADGSHCGYPGFRFYCHYRLNGRPVLDISSNLYYIEEFHQGSILIINLDFHEKSCPRPRRNLTVDHAFNPFSVDKIWSTNFTYFFNCTSKPPFTSLPSENEIGFSYSKFHLGCLDYNDTLRSSYAFRDDFINPKILEWSWKNCEENVVVPVLSDYSKIRFMENNTLERGFRVTWSTPIGCESCEKDGGLCVYDVMKRNFNCTYCELGFGEGKYRFNQSQDGYDCVPNHSSFSGGAIAGVVGLTTVIIFVLQLLEFAHP